MPDVSHLEACLEQGSTATSIPSTNLISLTKERPIFILEGQPLQQFCSFGRDVPGAVGEEGGHLFS